MKKIQNKYKVIANESLCPKYWRMVFDAPQMAAEVKAGQFVHIRTDEEGLQPFFRRPFSVFRAQKYVEIFYAVVGRGTKLLSLKKKGDSLEFFVKDTGTGISQDQKTVIFERFRQGTESLSRNYEGSGLGLSISKALVEMMGGEIWCESEEGIGSVFSFKLPPLVSGA